MHTYAKIVSLVALAATLIPCLLLFLGLIGNDASGHNIVKWIALAGTIVWFIATPIWMGRQLPIDEAEVEI